MRKTSTLIATAATGLALTLAAATPASAGIISCLLFGVCGGTTPRTPEIDPTLLRGTLTLVVGGVLVLADRRRRRG
jgi:hypothetical protein